MRIKFLRKMIAGMMTATLLSGLCLAMPFVAQAAGGPDVTVEVEAADDAILPEERFVIHLEPDSGVQAGETAQNGRINVYPGILPEVCDRELILDTGGTTASFGESAFDFSSVSYPQAGIYRYLLSEEEGKTPGMTYDDTLYYVDVYVKATWDAATQQESCEAVSVITYRALSERDDPTYVPDQVDSREEGDFVKEEPRFVNTLNTVDLTITKQVSGDQADYRWEFNFDLFVYEDTEALFPAGKTVTALISRQDNSMENITLQLVRRGSEEPSASFTLAHGESLTILALPEDTAYLVRENLVTEEEQSYDTMITLDAEEGSLEATEIERVIPPEGDRVTFTNERFAIVPTGIILRVAPFVGALAIGAAALLLKKRRERAEAED